MKLKSFGMTVILLLSLIGMGISCDDDDKKIVYNNLPVESRHFIENYFAGVEVSSVVKEDGEPHYKVELANGFTLKFYRNGGWQEVDGNGMEIPGPVQYDLLPGAILTYVAQEYPDASIVEMSQHNYGYEVNLGTQPEVELKFNRDGGIITDIVD
ncbi:PepSY-like domain-containing protein [Coprobacter sp.]